MIYLLILLLLIIAGIITYHILKKKGYYVYFRLNKDVSIGNECLHLEATFPDGTNIYRIKTEYVMMIHSERNRVIEEYLNYIGWLGVEKETIDAGLKNMIKLNDEMMLKPYEAESVTSRDKHHSIANNLLDRTPKAFTANRDNINKMYQMFYVLEGEDFRTVNKEFDKKKIELIERYPEYLPFFFQRLSKVTEHLGITWRNAIQIAMGTLMIKKQVSEIIDDLSQSTPQSTIKP